jgi:3-hydroxyacyl-[acyl-carrier-protein] dehydratase
MAKWLKRVNRFSELKIENGELRIVEINDIMKVIPHRPPFLLIDRVLEIVPGERVLAMKNVTMNEPFFPGHFPREPVMPGVLIVEAMAQAGAVALLSMPEYAGKIAYFGAIDKAKFRRKVVPGDTLHLEVEFVKLKKSAGIGRGTAFVGDVKAAEAELTFLIGD